jgi:hypothetical protein
VNSYEDKDLQRQSLPLNFDLVGRYNREREGVVYRDESDDLHVISVDPEEGLAFVDLEAAPEWLEAKACQEESDRVLLGGRFVINPRTMTYTEKSA